MAQLRMGKTVQESPETVIEKAVAYFGEEGLGLKPARQTEHGVYFTNDIGHVQVTAIPVSGGEETKIDIQTREWEYDVKKFMEQI